MKWLLFIYKVPTDSSTARVTIWRKIKKIGALYLQQTVCIVPYMDKFINDMKDLEKEIKSFGGDFKTFVVEALDDKEEKDIISQFNKQRIEEYMEIKEQCYNFFKEIEKETKLKNFSYAELEENEDELNKLHNWFEKVSQRDVFNVELKYEIISLLKKADEDFEVFASIIYDIYGKD
ncbi:MAG: Chromate resistance protein ChrB [Thermoanaerobacteraceae bacterium]